MATGISPRLLWVQVLKVHRAFKGDQPKAGASTGTWGIKQHFTAFKEISKPLKMIRISSHLFGNSRTSQETLRLDKSPEFVCLFGVICSQLAERWHGFLPRLWFTVWENNGESGFCMRVGGPQTHPCAHVQSPDLRHAGWGEQEGGKAVPS